MRVSELCIYPVKSCRAVRVEVAAVTGRGFAGDRRWLVVDEHGRLISQREVPRLALVQCTFIGEAIELRAPDAPVLVVAPAEARAPRITAHVWGSPAQALVHELGSRWFSAWTGRACQLAYMPGDVHRPVEGSDAIVSFADVYPYMLTTRASLHALNERLAEPIAMNRFRPNLVVDETAPFEEDAWTRLRIGEVAFRNEAPCDRCSVTTVEQETAATGVEPLRTLARFRRRDGKVWFGINLIAEGEGVVRVGDEVRVER